MLWKHRGCYGIASVAKETLLLLRKTLVTMNKPALFAKEKPPLLRKHFGCYGNTAVARKNLPLLR